MAKIQITVQGTIAKLEKYADELGYLSLIAVGQELDGTTIMGPNPQTKQEFLAEFLQNFVVKKLAKLRVETIDQEIRDQRIADKLAAETAAAADVSSAIV